MENNSNYISLKLKKPKPLVVVIVAAVVLLAAGLFFARGLFVAVTVNGSPISRLAVIGELEKQSGKQALDAMINKRLVENELNKQKVTLAPEEIEAEIKKLEAEVAGQGSTLEQALAAQGMTEEDLREQITIQKKLEKLLGDKVSVSADEVEAYIKDTKATPPAGTKMEEFKAQINEQLREQKLQQEAQKWVAELTANAKVKYYVNY